MGRSCNRYPDEIREKILYLKREGKTNREIGDAVGLSKDQIAWFLNNYYRALHKKDPEKRSLNYRERFALAYSTGGLQAFPGRCAYRF